MRKELIGVILISLLASGVVYFTWSDEGIKLRVDVDKTTYYLKNDNNRYIVSAREYNSLWDFPNKLNRDLNQTHIETLIDEHTNNSMVTRYTQYKRGPSIKDTYHIRGNVLDVEKFPESHKIEVHNGSGYVYQYEVRNLKYSGETLKDVKSPVQIGRIKIEFEEGYWNTLYKSGILKVRYRLDSDYEAFHNKVVDPELKDDKNGTVIEPVIIDLTKPVKLDNPYSLNLSDAGIDSYRYPINDTCISETDEYRITVLDCNQRRQADEQYTYDISIKSSKDSKYKIVISSNDGFEELNLKRDNIRYTPIKVGKNLISNIGDTFYDLKTDYDSSGDYTYSFRPSKDKGEFSIFVFDAKYTLDEAIKSNDYILLDPTWQTENIVAYYPFDGNAEDENGNYDGTVYSATLTTGVRGDANGAYLYNGNTYIDLGNAVTDDLTADFTICAWIKSTSDARMQILGNGDGTNGVFANIYDSGSWSACRWDVKNVGIYSVSAYGIPSGAWGFLCIVRDSSNNIRIWHNGTDRSHSNSLTSSGTMDHAKRFLIGQTHGGLTNFTGVVDELSIWDYELNVTEINDIMDNGVDLQDNVTVEIRINLSLEATNSSQLAELGSLITIVAETNVSGDTVCIDINHPDYGLNSSCDVDNVSIELNITYFNKTTTDENLTYSGHQNKTYNLSVHEYDEPISLMLNLQGFESSGSFPTGVKIYINDEISNEVGLLLNTTNYNVDLLDDNVTSKNISYSSLSITSKSGGYIKLPKEATVNDAYFNLTGYKFDEPVVYDTNMTIIANKSGGELNLTDEKYAFDSLWNTSAYYKPDASRAIYDSWINLNYSLKSGIPLYNVTTKFSLTKWTWGALWSNIRISCYDSTSWINIGYFDGDTYEGENTVELSIPTNCINNGDDTIQLNFSTYIGAQQASTTIFARLYDTQINYLDYSYPTNVGLEVGVLDGSKEWSQATTHNTTNITGNLSNAINHYLGLCTADSYGYCEVPVTLTSTSGIEEISNINIDYTYHTKNISLDIDLIETEISTLSGKANLTLTIESESSGIIEISNLRYYYVGGNQTYNIIAHDAGDTKTATHNVSYYYSGWDYAFPQYVDNMEFIGTAWDDVEIAPWGQTTTKPILNITAKHYGGRNMSMSLKVTGLNNCVNLSINDNSTFGGTKLSTNFTTFGTNFSSVTSKNFWMWLNLSYPGCGGPNRYIVPDLSFRACCDDCVCDTEVS